MHDHGEHRERGEYRDAADRADEAVSRGAWSEALTLLRTVADARPLTGAEYALRGRAAYGAGAFEDAVTAWEQAHRAHVDADEPVAAAEAAATVAMYLMMDTGLMAPVRGWVARAERLLSGDAEQPVHAWLAMVRTYERLLSGDAHQAAAWAQQAVEVGTRQNTPAPVAVARVAHARVRILDGDVSAGLRMLDEAAVATVSGELDALTVGMVYCELICAMQGLAQYDRAEQWTEAMERWRRGHAFGGMPGRCRVHRAEILRLRGSCAEAEAEALRACEELRPWMRREYGWPLTELGTIRLRKGDLAGAEEAFLAAHERGWDPQPGLALLRLAQGDAATAAELIDHALRHPRNVPFKEYPPYGDLPRAPLLSAQVEIALAAGDTALAGHAAAELRRIADAYRSRAFEAAAALAAGQVATATGDADAAAGACDEAVGIWSEIGAPYEASLARLALAQAHRARGSHDRAVLEVRAARATFTRLGAAGKAREAAAMAEGAPPTGEATEPSPAGETATGETTAGETAVFAREGDLRRIVFAGECVRLRDLKGMRYLACLLADPGREFHALDLVAVARATPPDAEAAPAPEEARVASSEDGLGPLLDRQAVQAYKRRLAEIDEDIEEATRMGDRERVSLATADREFIVAELSAAFGLGGRHRPVGARTERARASVTRAVRYALDRIAGHHHALAAHLRCTVHTGAYCSYTPDPAAPTRWRV